MAEITKQTQSKITSFASGTKSNQESSDTIESKMPNTSSKKKSKKKHLTSSESEAITDKEENARESLTQNGDLHSTLSSPSIAVNTTWTHEEEMTLVDKVHEYLVDKQSKEENKKKPIYLKAIEWDKIPQCGERTQQEAQSRFTTISNRVRKMRTALEVVEDMKERLKNSSSTTFSRKRKLVDPDLPKKPLSGFFQYQISKRKKMIHKHPELSQTEIAKKLSKRWNNMTDEKKKKYAEKYQDGMVEYQHQMIEYLQTHHHPNTSPPLSGYELWVINESKSIKSERPDISEKKLNKKLKRRWENLEDSAKKEWFQKEKGEINNYKKRVKHAEKGKVPSG